MRAEWIKESEKAGLKTAAQVMEKVNAIHAEIMGK